MVVAPYEPSDEMLQAGATKVHDLIERAMEKQDVLAQAVTLATEVWQAMADHGQTVDMLAGELGSEKLADFVLKLAALNAEQVLHGQSPANLAILLTAAMVSMVTFVPLEKRAELTNQLMDIIGSSVVDSIEEETTEKSNGDR